MIRSEWLDKGLTEATIKNYYPYKYQICDKSFMDKVIMEQDAKYAYAVELAYVISSSTYNQVQYSQFVFDAASNEPMAVIETGSASNFTGTSLKNLTDQVQGKRSKK